MTIPDPGVPIEVLRDAVRRHVEARTQRVVAAEIGLSNGWLDGFLNGASPRASTRRRLTEWYLRVSAKEAHELSTETARAALALLVGDLTPACRTRTYQEVLEALERAYRQECGRAPRWLIGLVSGEG